MKIQKKGKKKKPIPVNGKLYEEAKKEVYKKYKKHGAYRSGALVQRYVRMFKEKYGEKAEPYEGEKPKSSGLRRWYEEEWRANDGKVGYRKEGQVYRPTIRKTKKTPITFGELSEKEIRRAKKEKKKTGRVKRFRVNVSVPVKKKKKGV